MRHNDNLTAKLPNFVTHLECAMTGERYEAGQVHNLSKAGKPLLVRYDLAGVKKGLTKEKLAQRAPDLWRYRELLPVDDPANIVSLGETMTPIVTMPKLAAKLGGGEILVKDEGRLPTGSFKARGLVMAVSMAKALGIKHMAMPTNGNAGAALAAYAAHAGIKTTIFCPEDTPEVNVSEIELQGATVYRVNGLIDDCGKIVGEGKAKVGWFDTSTLKEPYRIEGKKTMGLELAEQLGWDLPDVIFYPTGGGTGLIGMWKAFAELEEIGFIGASARAWWRCRLQAVRRWCARSRTASNMRRAGRMRTRSPPGFVCLRRSAIFSFYAPCAKAAGSPSRSTTTRSSPRSTKWRRKKACCCVRKARRPMPPTSNPRRRPCEENRPGRAVQLRKRPEISVAAVASHARPA